MVILTKAQLATTALTLVSEHLKDLLDPANEINDWVDKLLCEQHCPVGGDCVRVEEDWAGELAAVKQEILDAVLALKDALVHRLNERIAALAGEAVDR